MSRCLLHYKGVDFHDDVDQSAWPATKASLADKLLYPNLPYVQDGDVMVTESTAVLKYLGRKYGLAPRNEKQLVMADQINGFLDDAFAKILKTLTCEDETEKMNSYRQLCETAVAFWTPIDDLLSKQKWTLGEDVCSIDFRMMAYISLWGDWVPDLLVKCKNLCKIEQQLRTDSPTLDKFLKNIKIGNFEPPAVPKLRLAYWPGRGRAHMTRCLLHFKGVDFHDDMDQSKWAETKVALADKLIYPNLPYIEDGSTMITESVAVLKYVGRKYGLAPSTEDQRVLDDQINSFLDDAFAKVITVFTCKDSEQQKELYKTLCENAVDFWTPIDGVLGKNKWTLGDQITTIDFRMMAYISLWGDWVPDLMAKCANLGNIETQLRTESGTLDAYLSELKMGNLEVPKM